jgi:hypothetical protein
MKSRESRGYFYCFAVPSAPLPKAMQIDNCIVFAYNIAELNISEFDFTISVQKEMGECLSAEKKNWHY